MGNSNTNSKSSNSKESAKKTDSKATEIKKKNKKGKHVKEEISPKSKSESKTTGKKSTITIKILRFFIIAFLILGVIYLGLYFFKPEKTNELFTPKSVSEYDQYIRNLTTDESLLLNGSVSTLKFVSKKYKDNTYYIATGFCDREYDIVYFNLKEDVDKVEKLSENTVLSYDKYVEYCKENNIKQKFTDGSKRYSIFSDFSGGYDTINVLVCDRQVDKDTEVLYLSKEYSGENSEVTSGFVVIFPSSQTNTTKTAMKEVISESDYCKMTGESMKITNSPINKDVLFVNNKTVTDDEKVNLVLNKMLDNICHQDTIHYSYTYDVPKIKTTNAKLDLNTCIQVVITKEGTNKKTQYTEYGDYESVDFSELEFIGNNWTYKDQIVKKFIQAESLSNVELFDFKLDEDDQYYIVKAFVSKQNYTIEGKVSREEEFLYIDKDTFELKKMYCHNYVTRYTVTFDYSNESVQLPDNVF